MFQVSWWFLGKGVPGNGVQLKQAGLSSQCAPICCESVEVIANGFQLTRLDWRRRLAALSGWDHVEQHFLPVRQFVKQAGLRSGNSFAIHGVSVNETSSELSRYDALRLSAVRRRSTPSTRITNSLPGRDTWTINEIEYIRAKRTDIENCAIHCRGFLAGDFLGTGGISRPIQSAAVREAGEHDSL
jgi:hypothetical protein